MRHATCRGGLYDRTGTGTQALVLVGFAQFCQGLRHIERYVIAGRFTQRMGLFERQPADRFFSIFNDDIEHAGFASGCRMRIGDGTARFGL
jgi:hypothetical protein